MTNTATRLITLIMLLQRQPNQTARELAAALDVSVRTLQRYIVMLDDLGVPVNAERGPYGGYSLVRGYRMPPLLFTPDEAVAVYLGTMLLQEVWGRLYQDAAHAALAKLDNVLPDKQRQDVARARAAVLALDLTGTDPDVAAPFVAHLRDAIYERHAVSMMYRSRTEPHPAPRTVDPYRLVSRWGMQYCIGYCHERRAVRTFRLDRIAHLDVLPDVFDEPQGFDLADYLAHDPFFQPQVHVRLRFGPDAALAAFNNRIYWDTLEEHPDGAVVVSFGAPNLEAAAGAVLRVGFGATILDPPDLLELVRTQAKALAAHFDAAPLKR